MTDQITVPRATWDAMREAFVTDAMIDAYLTEQRRTVEEADRFGRPNIGGLHTNTVREACRNGIRAALTAANAVSEQPLKVTDLGRYALEPQDKALKAAQANMSHYRETTGKGRPQATEPALTEHERRYADNLTAMFRNRETKEAIRSAMEPAAPDAKQ